MMTVTEDYPDNTTEYTLYSGGDINRGRQLFAQYPTQNVIERSVVMLDFGDDLAAINQMWINVRCLDLLDFNPVVVGVTAGIIVLLVAAIVVYHFRYSIFKPYVKKGYHKIEK
jgi:spermidine/putrescine transport system substrate-binding protein